MFNNFECDESPIQGIEPVSSSDTAYTLLFEEASSEARSSRQINAKDDCEPSTKKRSSFTAEFDKKEAERLVKALGDDTNGERAQKALQRMGRQALPILKIAQTDSTDMAVKQRATKAIEWIERTARAEEYEVAKEHYPQIVKLFRHGGIPTDFSERNIKPTAVPKNEQATIEKMLDSAKQLCTQPGYANALGNEPALIKNGVSEQYLEEYHKRYLSWHMSVDGARLYATSLAHGDDADQAKSRKYLAGALKTNNSLVDDEDFLLVARKAGANKDPEFVAVFLRSKGELTKLETKSRSK
jgi:hypothetical protein